MVARRLATLLSKDELQDINQILDIGSWHLDQSIEFANIFPHARIDAFEPVPDSYKLCTDKHSALDEDRKKRIHIHNIALNNTKGEIPFYAVDTSIEQKIDAGFSSMLRFNDTLKSNTYYGHSLVQKEIKVQADTLDNWCASNKITAIDIIWIDVQGAELFLFEGAEEILKHTRIIMTEVGLKPYYEGHTLKPDIDRFLLARGFRELDSSFELNGFDYEANTIYIKTPQN
jgi:FkbM family methyltransferase